MPTPSQASQHRPHGRAAASHGDATADCGASLYSTRSVAARR